MLLHPNLNPNLQEQKNPIKAECLCPPFHSSPASFFIFTFIKINLHSLS